MNKILSKITTQLFDAIEKDNNQFYQIKIGHYGVEYDKYLEKIKHYYYGHKIFEIDFKQKRKKI